MVDKETGQKLTIDNNFVMSPNDISTIEFLDELLKSGIKVLKIEGRGRAPEYVYTVVTAYRRAIDAVRAGTYSPELVEALLGDLNSVYNRGLSSGYYLGRDQGWSGQYGSKASKRKVQVGKVTHYYSKLRVAEIAATGKVSVGDDFVIVGKTTGVVDGRVAEIHLDHGKVEEARPKDVFSIRVGKKGAPE